MKACGGYLGRFVILQLNKLVRIEKVNAMYLYLMNFSIVAGPNEASIRDIFSISDDLLSVGVHNASLFGNPRYALGV